VGGGGGRGGLKETWLMERRGVIIGEVIMSKRWGEGGGGGFPAYSENCENCKDNK